MITRSDTPAPLSAPLMEPAPTAPVTDGRKQRSQDSQRRIVAAMLELVAAGNLEPSAEQIAEAAKVGLRSVFRHFKDMDTLYHQMSNSLASATYAVVRQPFTAADWRGRVLELIERRASVYEKLNNFLIASQVHRHRSPFLKAGHVRFVALSRQIIVDLLPAEAAREAVTVEAIDLLLSFETWHRLRTDQSLDVESAKRTLKKAVSALIQ
jgi:AcrR family transcriptional regulator